jgi:hypothetical protein
MVTALVLLLGGSTAAQGDHGVDNMYKNTGQPDCRAGSPRQDVCRADNLSHSWFISSGYSTTMLDATISAMGGWGHTDIDMNTVRETSLSYLYTDIHFWSDTSLTGTNALGNTDCLTAIDWLRCGAYQVRIRPDIYTGGYDLAKAVVCHEAGHTLGLLHGSQSVPVTSNQSVELGCMRTAPLTGDMRFRGTHNIWQINSAY